MASVQAMPGMQAGMGSLPPNITQEQVQQAYQVSHHAFNSTLGAAHPRYIIRKDANIHRNSNA
jgi:hypothetical protein